MNKNKYCANDFKLELFTAIIENNFYPMFLEKILKEIPEMVYCFNYEGIAEIDGKDVIIFNFDIDKIKPENTSLLIKYLNIFGYRYITENDKKFLVFNVDSIINLCNIEVKDFKIK
jgi:hypothetical protein